MRKFILLIAAFALVAVSCSDPLDDALNGKVVTLQTATDGNGVDLVIMGDGYTEAQINDGTYESIMKEAYEDFFTAEPFKTFRNMFNVYYVVGVSQTEGCNAGSTTCFNAKKNSSGSGITGDNDTVISFAEKAIGSTRVEHAVMAIVMNMSMESGTSYLRAYGNEGWGDGQAMAYVPYVGGGDLFRNIFVHEVGGHGVGKLGDENYSNKAMTDAIKEKLESYGPRGFYRNIDMTSDPASVKWAKFIADERYAGEGIGVYEGAYGCSTGTYRSTEKSLMYSPKVASTFNAPCREAIYITIHKLAYGSSWNYDYETFVKYDAVNR